MSYKTRLLSALREMQSKEHGIHAATVAECIKLAEEIPEEDGWISVKKQAPEEFVSVLVHIPELSPFPTVNEGYWFKNRWCTIHGFYSQNEVAYWMPMPKGPKEEK